MRLVMVGDLFFAVSMSIALVLDDAQNWKFQLGEHFTLDGIAGLLVLLCLFTLPFIASAIWAARTTRTGGTKPPLIPSEEAAHRNPDQGGKDRNGFRFSESHV